MKKYYLICLVIYALFISHDLYGVVNNWHGLSVFLPAFGLGVMVMGLSCLLTQWYCTKRAKELGLDSYVSSFDHEFYGKWLKRFNKTQPNTPERQALLDERDAKEEADLLANPSFWYGQAGYLIESCDEKYVPEILAAITHAESIRDNKYVQGIAQYFGLSTEKTVKARMAEIPAQRERQAERIREMLIKG